MAIEQIDKLSVDRPSVTYRALYDRERFLHGNAGYRPLILKLNLLRSIKSPTLLALEYADPPTEFVLDNGARVLTFDEDGRGGRIIQTVGAGAQSQARGILFWNDTGLTLTADTSILTGNKISLSITNRWAMVNIIATSANGIYRPTFRVRRAYDTVVAAEVLGVGDGTTTHFEFTTANQPVCPGSVKISFTDTGGVKTDLIRDNGEGHLGQCPPDLLLAGGIPSTIDYDTGEISIDFSSSHIPTASNITIDYEYYADGAKDSSEVATEWEMMPNCNV